MDETFLTLFGLITYSLFFITNRRESFFFPPWWSQDLNLFFIAEKGKKNNVVVYISLNSFSCPSMEIREENGESSTFYFIFVQIRESEKKKKKKDDVKIRESSVLEGTKRKCALLFYKGHFIVFWGRELVLQIWILFQPF